jgi:hypothetical protein
MKVLRLTIIAGLLEVQRREYYSTVGLNLNAAEG